MSKNRSTTAPTTEVMREPTNPYVPMLSMSKMNPPTRAPRTPTIRFPTNPKPDPFIISPAIQPASMPMMRNRIMFIEVKREKK